MKCSQPRRDWTAARMKCADGCRVCGSWYAQAAHIWKRDADFYPLGLPRRRYSKSTALKVEPMRIVPLCPEDHRAFDEGRLDLLPHLTLEEQLQAVADAGGIELARRRLAPSVYDSKAAA